MLLLLEAEAGESGVLANKAVFFPKLGTLGINVPSVLASVNKYKMPLKNKRPT